MSIRIPEVTPEEEEWRRMIASNGQRNFFTRTADHPPFSVKATDKQVSGDHYKKLAIQPIAYIHANKLPFCEGSVVKYITRWRDKGGLADLEKAKHFIELLIELESQNGANP
jgi:hypothetical protein